MSFPRLKDIIFVTEPEAAAIYTARIEKLAMGKEFLKVFRRPLLVVRICIYTVTGERMFYSL